MDDGRRATQTMVFSLLFIYVMTSLYVYK